MTVSELQEALAQHPPDAEVYVEAADGGAVPADGVAESALIEDLHVPDQGPGIVVIGRAEWGAEP